MARKESNGLEAMRQVYTAELVENLLNAYGNMERLGMISHRRFLRYRRELKQIQGTKRKDGA